MTYRALKNFCMAGRVVARGEEISFASSEEARDLVREGKVKLIGGWRGISRVSKGVTR